MEKILEVLNVLSDAKARGKAILIKPKDRSSEYSATDFSFNIEEGVFCFYNISTYSTVLDTFRLDEVEYIYQCTAIEHASYIEYTNKKLVLEL